MNVFASVAGFIRWRDWGPGKVTLLCSVCLYMAMAYHLAFGAFILTFILFLFFASAQSALGFVLNDWGDRDLDRCQGKPNVFNERSAAQGYLGLILTFLAAALTGIHFITHPAFAPLWAAWVLAAAAYSVEPLRLKTHGTIGLIASFTAQWSLPVLLAFAAFEKLGSAEGWLLALALTVSGGTLEIAHQRHDRARDASTQARTFGASLSMDKLDIIYGAAVVLDKLAVGLATGLIAWALASLGEWWSVGLAIIALSAYAILLIVTLPKALRALTGGAVQDPYYSEGHSATRLLHETLPNLGLPMALAIGATLRASEYGIILILFALWRIVLGGADWRWPLRALQRKLGQ